MAGTVETGIGAVLQDRVRSGRGSVRVRGPVRLLAAAVAAARGVGFVRGSVLLRDRVRLGRGSVRFFAAAAAGVSNSSSSSSLVPSSSSSNNASNLRSRHQ